MSEHTGIVMVHGGVHAGDCWQPTVEALADIGHSSVLAVDLPGRRSQSGDLGSLTIEDCVDSVLEQIMHAEFGRVMLVGHSMAGITLPGVAAALGDLLVRTVFLACSVPPVGRSVLDVQRGPVRIMARRAIRGGRVTKPLPRPVASWLFCNGMTADQHAYAMTCLHADAPGVLLEPARAWTATAPRTWILTARDRAISPRRQRSYIENLGGVDEVVTLDTCHNAMISAPRELARLLADRAN